MGTMYVNPCKKKIRNIQRRKVLKELCSNHQISTATAILIIGIGSQNAKMLSPKQSPAKKLSFCKEVFFSFAGWPLFLSFFHFWSFQIFGGLTSRVARFIPQFHPCFFKARRRKKVRGNNQNIMYKINI